MLSLSFAGSENDSSWICDAVDCTSSSMLGFSAIALPSGWEVEVNVEWSWKEIWSAEDGRCSGNKQVRARTYKRMPFANKYVRLTLRQRRKYPAT